MLDFLRDETRHKRGIRYVINTHYHADHVYGNYLFPEADIISSERCREILRKSGEKSLNEAKQTNPELAEVQLRLPNLTFPDKLTIHLGDRVLRLTPLPGHTQDGIGIYVEGEKILFSGDAVMALPHIYWGDRETLLNTLTHIKEMNVENIIQGHGDVLLKGEIDESIDAGIAYLTCIYDRVKAKVATRTSKEKLADITLESCGGTPIALDGVVRKLHKDNVQRIYQQLTAKPRS
jgi:glyoxylase-like metal-dependent hydrolase (beta-lactamase superfamily II)